MSRRTNVRNWPSRGLSNRALLHTQEERLDAFGAFLFMGSVNAALPVSADPNCLPATSALVLCPQGLTFQRRPAAPLFPKLTELCRRDAVAYGGRACFQDCNRIRAKYYRSLGSNWNKISESHYFGASPTGEKAARNDGHVSTNKTTGFSARSLYTHFRSRNNCPTGENLSAEGSSGTR